MNNRHILLFAFANHRTRHFTRVPLYRSICLPCKLNYDINKYNDWKWASWHHRITPLRLCSYICRPTHTFSTKPDTKILSLHTSAKNLRTKCFYLKKKCSSCFSNFIWCSLLTHSLIANVSKSSLLTCSPDNYKWA